MTCFVNIPSQAVWVHGCIPNNGSRRAPHVPSSSISVHLAGYKPEEVQLKCSQRQLCDGIISRCREQVRHSLSLRLHRLTFFSLIFFSPFTTPSVCFLSSSSLHKLGLVPPRSPQTPAASDVGAACQSLTAAFSRSRHGKPRSLPDLSFSIPHCHIHWIESHFPQVPALLCAPGLLFTFVTASSWRRGTGTGKEPTKEPHLSAVQPRTFQPSSAD